MHNIAPDIFPINKLPTQIITILSRYIDRLFYLWLGSYDVGCNCDKTTHLINPLPFTTSKTKGHINTASVVHVSESKTCIHVFFYALILLETVKIESE